VGTPSGKEQYLMLHSDIVPEHACPGELIDVSQKPDLHQVWCASCGTEFTYAPDSDWVTIVFPGMQSTQK